MLLVVTISCDTDEFLDRPSQTAVSAARFWSNEAEAIQGVNGVYNYLRTRDNFTWLTLWEDVLTDDATWKAVEDRLYGGLAWGFETAEGNNSYSLRAWSGSYEVIVAANTAINKIPEIDMDEDLAKRLIAEAKFLRAYFYHRLQVRYGGVPMPTKLPELEEFQPERKSRAEVVALVRQDLNDAIENLPWQHTGNEVGRVTKGAAYCLLARSYLFNKQFEEAADAANAAMSGPYSLISNFADLWELGNQNTVESLWEIQYGNSENGDYGEHWRRGPSNGTARQFGLNNGAAGGGFSTPIQDLVNDFETVFDDNSDGILDRAEPFATPQPDSNDLTQFENRDPRLGMSILYHGADYYGTPYQRTWNTFSSYSYRKYTVSRYHPLVFGGNSAPFNWIEMRYPEVLLQFAEATNEISGPTVAVHDAVNQVRRRVGMPDVPASVNKDEMREYIHREWRVEFAGESKRYEFLLRTDGLGEALRDKHLNPKIDYEISNWAEFNGFRKLWPISQQEIDANPNLCQNPGWGGSECL